MPTTLLLTLTLLLCGTYCGMTLFCQIGLLPAMRRVAPQTFRESWTAIDSLMDRAMPPFKLTLLVLNLGLVILAYRGGQMGLATYAGMSFLLSLIALVLTIAIQIPVNKQIGAATAATSDDALRNLLSKTGTNFTVRFVLALASFLALCIAATHYPRQA